LCKISAFLLALVCTLYLPASVATPIDVPGYNFAAVANILLGSRGKFSTNFGSAIDSLTDNLASSWASSSDNPAYVDLLFSTNVYDGDGIDLSIFFVGAGGHSVGLTLYSGGVSSTTRYYNNPIYTGFNTDGGTNGIFVVDVDLADFGFLGVDPLDKIRLDISNASAVPSLVGAYNVTPSAASLSGPLVDILLGDLAPLNQPDGQLNAGDLVVMQRLVLGQLSASPEQTIAADVAPLNNSDGDINAGDLVVLERAVNGDIALSSVSYPSGGLMPPYLVPPAAHVNQASIILSGVAAPGQNVKIYVDNILASNVTSDAAGKLQIPIDLQVGPNNIYAVALAGGIESEPSNLVNVYYDTTLPTVNWSDVTITDIGDGNINIDAAPGTVKANSTISLTSKSGETQSIVSQADGSFTAVLPGDVKTITINPTIFAGTYALDERALASDVLGFVGTGAYNGTGYIYPPNKPKDIVDNSALTFIATAPYAGYDNISVDLGFDGVQVVNGVGADVVLFFLYQQNSNTITATVNGITKTLTVSNVYDSAGTQQVANGVVWNGVVQNNVLIQSAKIDLTAFGIQPNRPLSGTLRVGMSQAGSTVPVVFSMAGALNIAPAIDAHSITAVVADGTGNTSPVSGNRAVGAMAGTFLVNETGAATYSIPIDVPPGISGMQPDMSLNYNSQGGNGLLGLGWNLGGLSAITRCSKTYATDAVYDGVSYDSQDRFCLDGQRLINVTGGYGQDGTVYRTEVDSFSTITQNGNTCGGPCGFTVQTKSGQTIVYGNSDNTTGNVTGSQAALYWAINTVTDISGNTIQYEYFKDSSGNHQISRITYVNDAAPRYIEFSYESRLDVVNGYVAGTLTSAKYRLQAVLTKIGLKKIKEYRLSYETGAVTHASRINAVTECGFDATGSEVCIPPTNFTWQQGSVGYAPTLTTPNTVSLNPGFYWQADFDGDGRQEIASAAGSQITLWKYSGLTSSTGSISQISRVVDGHWGAAAYTQIGDFNGDGKADIASEVGTSVFMKFGANGDFGSATWAVDGLWGSGDYTWSGDFNGDGLTDIASASGANVYMKLSTGSGFTSTTWPVQSAWGSSPYTWVADFNGDGLMDIASASGANVYLKLSTGTGFVSKTWTVTSNWSDADHTWVGDLNGDGKADIATSSGTTINVKLSTGSGFVEGAWTVPNLATGYSVSAMFDYNGDGLLDAALDNYNALDLAVISVSSGDKFAAPVPITPIASANSRFTYGKNNMFFGDFDGDGYSDFSNYSNNVLSVRKSSIKPEGMVSITPGFGPQVNIAYKSLTDSYSSGSCPGYPVRCTPMPISVVSEHYADDGIGGISRYTYFYSDARVHLRGRGFLGFNSTEVVDEQTGVFTTTYFNNDVSQTTVDTYPDRYPYAGMVSMLKTVLPRRSFNSITSPTYTSMQVSQFALKQTTPGTYFPYARVKVSNQHELSGTIRSTTTTTTDYDLYGNATQVTAQTVGGGETFTISTTNQYDPARLQFGRLTRSTVTHSGPDGVATRTSAFTYYPDGLLKAEIIEPDLADTSPLKQTTSYEYDTFGNKTKVSITALAGDSPTSGLQTRTTQTRYDSNGLFPVRSINALGQDEHYLYDPRFGVKTQLIGPNRLPTSWEYDALGRLVRESRADGNETTIAFDWCPASLCPNGGTKTTRTTSGVKHAIVYKDIKGREIRTETEGMRPGSLVVQRTEYDLFGRVSRKSRPYYAGNIPQWTTFSYDKFDRVMQEKTPDGGQVDYTYSFFDKVATTTVIGGDVPTVSRTETYDAMDRLRKVVEEGGITTTYGYDALDHQVRVTDTVGNVTVLNYDLRGRKTSMDDPDMGHWVYRYNGFGDLVYQQDNKLQEVTLSYDLLGRMVRRNEPEGLTTWIYDSAPHGIGKLTSIKAPGN